MIQNLEIALQNELWLAHKIGDTYSMVNVGGKVDLGWSIAYYPLFGTYRDNKWIEFNGEARALVEKKTPIGTDFREIPLRYLIKQ